MKTTIEITIETPFEYDTKDERQKSPEYAQSFHEALVDMATMRKEEINMVLYMFDKFLKKDGYLLDYSHKLTIHKDDTRVGFKQIVDAPKGTKARLTFEEFIYQYNNAYQIIGNGFITRVKHKLPGHHYFFTMIDDKNICIVIDNEEKEHLESI